MQEMERPAEDGASGRPDIVPDQRCDDIESDEPAQPRWFEVAIAAILDSVDEPIPIIVAVLLRLAARKLASVDPLPARYKNAALFFFRQCAIEAKEAGFYVSPELAEAWRSESAKLMRKRRAA